MIFKQVKKMIARKQTAIRELERQQTGCIKIKIPIKLHPASAELVADFASAMAAKLRASEMKYGYSDGWHSSEWMDECREQLRKHVLKGDPVDVANYCAFLWYHCETTEFKDH